jgi:5-deoxy-glucuronate isomerase
MSERRGHSSLLIRANEVRNGEIVVVERNGDDWKYINFRAVHVRAGQSLRAETRDDEVVIVLIAGTVDIVSSAGTWRGVGKRINPFSGSPEAVYLPSSLTYEIRATADAEIAICGAPARGAFAARVIATPADAEYMRGDGQAKRRVRNILMNDGEAGTLFLTEVVTLPGNWSSYPPHKHDTDDPPFESELEELYYYRAQPQQGFAFQRVYTANGELDETMTVRDRDVVLVPRGYHVCAAAAGYWIYYLNVLAGPKHIYHMSFDPPHEWIKENWEW